MKTRTLAILVALLLALPFAAAEWRGQGFYEPDTDRDAEDGFMFADPNQQAGTKAVYFNAYPALYGYAVRSGPNPNSPELGSQILPYPTDIHAMLGIWTDCNKDGYIGMALGGLREYRAELLPSTDVCPTSAVFPTGASDTNFRAAHNDGKWVREFIAIGPDVAGGNTALTNPYNIDDRDARVWADWGQPEYGSNPTCISLPVSRGNFRSTGGFLRWADCIANYRITSNINALAHLTGQDSLAFDDAPKEYPDQSSSALNQKNPWGTESESSYVTAFDCSAPIEQTVTDPTGGQLSGPIGQPGTATVTIFNGTTHQTTVFVAGTPTTPSLNPSGSLAGTVNETTEVTAAGSCDRSDDAGGVGSGEIYEAIENSQEGTPPSGRTSTDIWFEFQEGSNECAAASQPDSCTPGHAGLGFLRSEVVTGRASSGWIGLPGYVVSRNPYISRDTLSPWGAVWLTAYAKVGANPEYVLASTATGIYGSPHCNGTTPITGAWKCDPAQWYVDSNGNKITAPHADWQLTPGTAYQLRDVDCFNQNVMREQPIGFESIGYDRCERPS